MNPNKFLHNEQGDLSAINASMVVILSLIFVYTTVHIIGILMGVPQIVTTADSVLVVLIPVLGLLYIFRQREAKKDMKPVIAGIIYFGVMLLVLYVGANITQLSPSLGRFRPIILIVCAVLVGLLIGLCLFTRTDKSEAMDSEAKKDMEARIDEREP